MSHGATAAALVLLSMCVLAFAGGSNDDETTHSAEDSPDSPDLRTQTLPMDPSRVRVSKSRVRDTESGHLEHPYPVRGTFKSIGLLNPRPEDYGNPEEERLPSKKDALRQYSLRRESGSTDASEDAEEDERVMGMRPRRPSAANEELADIITAAESGNTAKTLGKWDVRNPVKCYEEHSAHWSKDLFEEDPTELIMQSKTSPNVVFSKSSEVSAYKDNVIDLWAYTIKSINPFAYGVEVPRLFKESADTEIEAMRQDADDERHGNKSSRVRQESPHDGILRKKALEEKIASWKSVDPKVPYASAWYHFFFLLNECQLASYMALEIHRKDAGKSGPVEAFSIHSVAAYPPSEIVSANSMDEHFPKHIPSQLLTSLLDALPQVLEHEQQPATPVPTTFLCCVKGNQAALKLYLRAGFDLCTTSLEIEKDISVSEKALVIASSKVTEEESRFACNSPIINNACCSYCIHMARVSPGPALTDEEESVTSGPLHAPKFGPLHAPNAWQPLPDVGKPLLEGRYISGQNLFRSALAMGAHPWKGGFLGAHRRGSRPESPSFPDFAIGTSTDSEETPVEEESSTGSSTALGEDSSRRMSFNAMGEQLRKIDKERTSEGKPTTHTKKRSRSVELPNDRISRKISERGQSAPSQFTPSRKDEER